MKPLNKFALDAGPDRSSEKAVRAHDADWLTGDKANAGQHLDFVIKETTADKSDSQFPLGYNRSAQVEARSFPIAVKNSAPGVHHSRNGQAQEPVIARALNKPKEARSFKLDPDVYEGLKRRAVKENRSINNLAETLLWNEVKAELN